MTAMKQILLVEKALPEMTFSIQQLLFLYVSYILCVPSVGEILVPPSWLLCCIIINLQYILEFIVHSVFILLWGKTGISKTGPYVYILFFQDNKFFPKVLGLQEVSAKAAAYSAAKKDFLIAVYDCCSKNLKQKILFHGTIVMILDVQVNSCSRILTATRFKICNSIDKC